MLSPPKQRYNTVVSGTRAIVLLCKQLTSCYHPNSFIPHEINLIECGREMFRRNSIAITGEPVAA